METTANCVLTDPFTEGNCTYFAARTCSNLHDNHFMTEFINCSDKSIKIPAGEIIGHAQLVDDGFLNANTSETQMSCAYRYDGGDKLSPPTPPKHNQTPTTTPKINADQHPTQTAYSDPSPMSVPLAEEIPPGAKPLKIDLSDIAPDARPYEPQLRNVFEKRKAAFSRHDRDYGKTKLVQYRANMKDRDQNPIAQPPYRTRPEMREIVDNQAHQMIADGLVRPSTSPYAAPILLSKKKCGGWRFLTDFRKINECCEKIVFPLPRIEDSIQRLEDPQFFSAMDLTKGFWQIPIHEDDRKFFAFSTESMHLEYLVAPMGAKNSPSYLSALMQLVLRGLPIQNIISYLDDILVANSNMEDHLSHLDQVLSALEKAGLKLNPSKCSFARDTVVCLGHKLSRAGISPDPANIEKVKSWKPPTTTKQVRAFLGLTGYYRSFIQNYSEIARCLTDLTRDDVKWAWTPQHQKSFETLRDTLISDKVMAFPNFSEPFIIKTDASLTAIGYVLCQKVDGKEKVISYGSKKLSRTQQRWSTYDREYFALIAAIRANAHYLRHASFLAITDHRPLLSWRKMDSKKDPTGRRTRWALELDCYEFDLSYKKGKAHQDADAMSRRGDEDEELAIDDDDFFGLSFLEDNPDDPADDFFLVLGMQESDEHSMSRCNAEPAAKKRLKQEQNADQIIAEVKSYVKNRKRLPRDFPGTWYKRNNKWLVMKEGILYRRSYSETIHANILQAIIPDSMISETLSDLHGSNWSGHPSVGKILLKAHRYVTWPSIAKDVNEKVKNCLTCDQLREQVPKPLTPLQPIIATNVFDHVMCDLISFTTPSSGFKYVLVFKDVFSGFIRCYKLRDKTTKGVVKAFEDLVCFLGPPRLLSSDNGGEFVSGSLREACRLLGVEKRTGVPYRPQSQGNVERQNRVLIKDLQHRLLQYGKSWSEHLAFVEWAHNTTPFAKTRMSPYFLFFGREPYLPSYAEPVETKMVDTLTEKYRVELKKKMSEIYAEANKRAEEKRKKEAEYYNRKVKHEPFQPGDKAWEQVHVRGKLQPKWDGPVTIKTRRTNPSSNGTTYICEKKDGSSCKRNFEQLKRVNAKYEKNMQEPPTEAKPKEKTLCSPLLTLLSLFTADPPAVPAPVAAPLTGLAPATGPAPAAGPASATGPAPAARTAQPTAPAQPAILAEPTGPSQPTATNQPVARPNTTTESQPSAEINGTPSFTYQPILHLSVEKICEPSPAPPAAVLGPSTSKQATNISLINSTGDTTVESASSLNLGFLENSESIPEEAQRLALPRPDIPKSPDTAYAPSTPNNNPPRHPILDCLDDSAFFYTPSTAPEENSSPELQAIETSPEDESPNRTGLLKKRMACRKLYLEASQKYADPANPNLVTGEVSSGQITPTPETAGFAALEVFAPGGTSYLIKSPAGQICISRVKPEGGRETNAEPPNPDRPTSQQSAENSPGQALAHTGQRELRTKIREKGNQARSTSVNSVYPRSLVNQINTNRETNQQDLQKSPSLDDLAPKSKPDQPRRNGKFVKTLKQKPDK